MEATNEQTVTKTPPGSKKPFNFMLLIIPVIAIVAIIAIVGILKSSKKINLNDYVTITYEGYNTRGTAKYTFNSSQFVEDYGDKLKLNKSQAKKAIRAEGVDPGSIIGQELLKESALSWLNTMYYGKLSPNKDLSNGDTITFTWETSSDNIEKLFNYKIVTEDLTKTVTGLEELQMFDPFEHVVMNYGGYSTEGAAVVTYDAPSSYPFAIDYQIEPNNNLANGQEITVTAYSSYSDLEQMAISYGMLPTCTEKTYIVEGMAEYVMDPAQITSEVMEKMEKQGKDVITAESTTWRSYATLADIKCIGNYFLTRKEGVTGYFNSNNINTMLYKVYVNVDSEATGLHDQIAFYYSVSFNNIIKMPDDTISVDLSKYNDVGWSSISFTFDDPPLSRGLLWETDLYFDGYQTLDEAFAKCVTEKVDNYNYINNVVDVE